jgi:hypothetical protein
MATSVGGAGAEHAALAMIVSASATRVAMWEQVEAKCMRAHDAQSGASFGTVGPSVFGGARAEISRTDDDSRRAWARRHGADASVGMVPMSRRRVAD